MAGPWEQFQKAEGPWSKYGTKEPTVDYGEDMLRAGASGVRQGIESTLGMFGDAAGLNANITKRIADWAGAPEGVSQFLSSATKFLNPAMAFAPSTEEIRSLTNPVMGEGYEAETVPGQYAQTLGQFLPGAAAGPGSLPQRMLLQTLLPALGSETAGQMTDGTAAEPYARIVGALAGGSAPSAARRVVTPFPASPERLSAADVLAREGVDLTAGQRTGSDKLRYMESELGGLGGQQFMERQGDQFTRAALSRAGVDANRATPEVMDQAFTRIGQQFDDLAANHTLLADRQMWDEFSDVLRHYAELVPEASRAPIVRDTMQNLVDTRRQGMTGESYQALRSRLDKAARTASRDPQLSEALFGMRNSLDDAMERSIAASAPDDVGAWREVRNQYRNMLVLEKAASGAGENAALGIISPSQLRNATVQQSRRGYARGRGDFAELARSGEAAMKPLPQSGTSPRMNAKNLGMGIATMLGGAAGGAATQGNPAAMIAGMLAGSAVPAMAGKAMLSGPGRAYLGNQLVGPGGGAGPNATRAAIAALLAGQQNRPAIAP